MSVTATPKVVQNEQKCFRVIGTITPAGTAGATGDVLSFAKFGIPNTTPLIVKIQGDSGYVYKYNTSSGKFQVYIVPDATGLASAAPMVLIGNVEYPAAVTADNILFEAVFPKV